MNKKVQKNLNLSSVSVEKFLPALRIAFGTYTTAVDVALERLYRDTVAEAVDIQDSIEQIERKVADVAQDLLVAVDAVEFRYDPNQGFDEVPKWTLIRVTNQRRRDAMFNCIAEMGLTVYKERAGNNYYLTVRSQDFSSD